MESDLADLSSGDSDVLRQRQKQSDCPGSSDEMTARAVNKEAK